MAARDAQYATGVESRPELDRHFQSRVKGLHIIGAANGSPLLKTCINEGVQVIRSIRRLMPPAAETSGPEDLVIIGAGPAGISAALEATRSGYRFRILEQGRPLNTILNFPVGKRVYAEPATLRSLGDLDLEDASKEELLARWEPAAAGLEIVRGADVTDISRQDGFFTVTTKNGEKYQGRRVILAIGRMGNPRRLGVTGEDLPCVYTALLNPGKYRDREIVVIGGGNSAAEAALALAENNRVTLVYRGEAFNRLNRANSDQLEQARAANRIRVLLKATCTAFRQGELDIEVEGKTKTLRRDVAFVLIGADPPTSFLKRLGVIFEGQLAWRLLPQLAWVLALVYTIYGIKFGKWPFAGLYHSLLAARIDPGLLYGILYTALLTFFGLRARQKYRQDPYQRRRYTTLIGAQWLVYFLLPWLLFYAGYTEWWRPWGITLTYPLGYYALWEPGSSLFAGSSLPWAIGALVSFLIVMPVLSIYHGKRFCSWFCPCGGLADTVGDAFRHRAPRGQGVRRLETASTVILVLTVLCSIYLIGGYRRFLAPDQVVNSYKLVVDVGLASIVAITLYPFAGSRIWCRFFCPLAKWMELWARWTGGKLAIVSNDECISCGECTRYCQMGIDVRAFAAREQPLSNLTTSCVFCGICVFVCPVDVLRVERNPARASKG